MRGWWLVGLGGVALLVGAAAAVGMSVTRSSPAAAVAEVPPPPPPPRARCREIQVGQDVSWVDPDGWPCVQSDAGTWRPVPR